MNYPPKHHQEAHLENIITTIKAYPLATLITIENDMPIVTHLPLLFETVPNSLGKLIGHIDRNNPQVVQLQQTKECTVIFNGPQTYISPSIYSTKQLPTWNYIKVHLKGIPKIIEDNEFVKSSIVTMTEILEGAHPKYALKQDDPRMASLIDYIVGFEITITGWEGKYKLSQDKLKIDQDAAKNELKASEPPSKADYINSIYTNHVTLK